MNTKINVLVAVAALLLGARADAESAGGPGGTKNNPSGNFGFYTNGWPPALFSIYHPLVFHAGFGLNLTDVWGDQFGNTVMTMGQGLLAAGSGSAGSIIIKWKAPKSGIYTARVRAAQFHNWKTNCEGAGNSVSLNASGWGGHAVDSYAPCSSSKVLERTQHLFVNGEFWLTLKGQPNTVHWINFDVSEVSNDPCDASPTIVNLTGSGTNTQTVTYDAGTENAGNTFVLLGSASGTSPGIELPNVHIPLNPDPYLNITINFASATASKVDANGIATAQIVVPPLPSTFAGFSVDHAFVILGPGGEILESSASAPLLLGL